jgi:hypothetical protein
MTGTKNQHNTHNVNSGQIHAVNQAEPLGAGLIPNHLNKASIQSVIDKTLGGLSRAYYFRQFFFGLLFVALIVMMMFSQNGPGMSLGMAVMIVINALLYPYSRFVYESIVRFIMGENIFVVNALLMLAVKFMMMSLCFSAAIFIAPFGLVYLYYHHSKNNS